MCLAPVSSLALSAVWRLLILCKSTLMVTNTLFVGQAWGLITSTAIDSNVLNWSLCSLLSPSLPFYLWIFVCCVDPCSWSDDVTYCFLCFFACLVFLFEFWSGKRLPSDFPSGNSDTHIHMQSTSTSGLWRMLETIVGVFLGLVVLVILITRDALRAARVLKLAQYLRRRFFSSW